MKKLIQVLDQVRTKTELALDEKASTVSDSPLGTKSRQMDLSEEAGVKAESGIMRAQQKTKIKTEPPKNHIQPEQKKIGKDLQSEKLEKKIAHNFARLFFELCDQLKKWNSISLKEYNGILEIKFGEEIYQNRFLYVP